MKPREILTIALYIAMLLPALVMWALRACGRLLFCAVDVAATMLTAVAVRLWYGRRGRRQ